MSSVSYESAICQTLRQNRGDRVGFDCRVRLEFPGRQFGSDGGLPVMRELDDAPGLSDPALAALRDSRQGRNTDHRINGLFRQAVYGLLNVTEN